MFCWLRNKIHRLLGLCEATKAHASWSTWLIQTLTHLTHGFPTLVQLKEYLQVHCLAWHIRTLCMWFRTVHNQARPSLDSALSCGKRVRICVNNRSGFLPSKAPASVPEAQPIHKEVSWLQCAHSIESLQWMFLHCTHNCAFRSQAAQSYSTSSETSDACVRENGSDSKYIHQVIHSHKLKYKACSKHSTLRRNP